MLARRFPHASDVAFSLLTRDETWPEPGATPIGFVREADPIAALHDAALGGRFRNWRGGSGRRYVFSVYDAASCPAYCDAVLIDVAVDADGRRQAVAFEDTGSCPEPVMSALSRNDAPGRNREIHVHLLARTKAERNALLADLRASA